MTTLSIQPPFPLITDIDGQPLEDGYIWIGVANLPPIGNPVSVYWDAALTQPAALPVRTRGGYPVNAGTPARLYVDSDYSILVQNKNGSTIYSAPAATERYSGVVVEISSTDVSFLQAGTGAVTRTAQSKMRETVSVLDYGAAESAAAATNTAAINAAATYCRSNGAELKIPAVATFYSVDGTLDLTGISVIDGRGGEIRGTFGAIPAIKIGGGVTNGSIWLEVRNATDKSTTSGNRGFLLEDLNECKLWLYARGFNEGVYFDGVTANRAWVGNEFNIIKLYNNGSHVHFDLAGTSYAVANQFIGGGYYLGTNDKVGARGTFKMTMAGSSLASENVVINSEIGIDGGSTNADHGILLYATLNTSSNGNAVFFQNTRFEAYGSWADPANVVNIPTVTSGQLNINAEFLSSSFSGENFLVSIPEDTSIDVKLRYMGGSGAGAPQLPISIEPSFAIPYQMDNAIYVPNRILYDSATGYNVPVESITTGVSSRTNRALGNGSLVMSTATNAVGMIYGKQTTRPAFLQIPNKNRQLAIVCFDSSGNVLSGTAPYYARGRRFRSVTRGSVGIYEAVSNWVWLHKDVASFFIGQAAWAQPDSFDVNLSFNATFGAEVFDVYPLGVTAPNEITSDPGGSYFRRGMQVYGRSSNNGFRNVFLLETTTNASALSGATAINATSVSGVASEDYIGIELDTVIVGAERQWFHTRVASIVGSTINLTSALPAAVASGRKIKVNRWQTLEAVNRTATAADIASVAAAVNTNGKYEGVLVWDSTNNRMMRASGRSPTNVWWVVDGSASVTPV